MKFFDRKVASFAVILLAVPFVPRNKESVVSPEAPAVKTVRVRSGVVESTLRLTGSLSAEDSITLRAPRLPGRRSRGGARDFSLTLLKLIKPGAIVSPGDVIAEFDPQYLRQRLDDERASVAQEEKNFHRLQTQLEVTMSAHRQQIRVAKGELDKAALELKTIPVRSRIQAEVLRLVHEEAKARYERLLKELPLREISERAALRVNELDITDDRLELKRAEANLDRLVMTTPIRGIVVPQPIRRGAEMAEVEQGDELRYGQPFVNIVNTDSLLVEANANQVDAELLRLGLSARVRFDSLPNVVLPAKVAAVGAVATATRMRPDYTRQIPVRLKLDSTHPQAFPNATVSADVVLGTEEAPAIVPRQCVFESADGSPVAYVRADNGWQTRELILGLSNHIEVAVLEGLREGDLVATEEIATR